MSYQAWVYCDGKLPRLCLSAEQYATALASGWTDSPARVEVAAPGWPVTPVDLVAPEPDPEPEPEPVPIRRRGRPRKVQVYA